MILCQYSLHFSPISRSTSESCILTLTLLHHWFWIFYYLIDIPYYVSMLMFTYQYWLPNKFMNIFTSSSMVIFTEMFSLSWYICHADWVVDLSQSDTPSTHCCIHFTQPSLLWKQNCLLYSFIHQLSHVWHTKSFVTTNKIKIHVT